MFSIRVATREDDSAVSELLKASYPVLMKASYDAAVLARALPLMTRANPALLSSGTYYLSETGDGRIAGCGGWTLEQPGSGEVTPGLAHIRHFATHPDLIGRGIGKATYAVCEADARKAGAWQYECYASLNAKGFYQSLGFNEVCQMEVVMGSELRFPSLLMRRVI